MTVDNIKGVSAEAFESVLKTQPEWLHSHKRDAWNTYNNLTFNGKKEKFADVIESMEIEQRNFVNKLANPSDLDNFREHWGELGGCFVNNGSTFLNDDLAKSGVILKSLKSALVENEDLVKQYLTKNNITARDSRFTALAESMWTDGVLLYVPKDTDVSLPVHLLKWTNQGNTQNYYKTLVVVESGSKVTLIDEYNSENTDDFFLVDGINELHIKDNANVTYLHLQNFDYNAFNFSLQKAVLGKDARLLMLSLSMGSQFSYENIRTYMEESGSHAEILGLVVGDKEQVFQHETLQYHPKPSATSNLHFEVMLRGKAESAHNGFVQIEKQAQMTDARQLIRNLLLSRKAKAEAIPNLEILADDVKCAHGVSLGPVNAEELFYLNSRGFDIEQASNFIIEGNIEKVMSIIAEETDSDEDDEETVNDEHYFDEKVNLATRVRDYVLNNLSGQGNN